MSIRNELLQKILAASGGVADGYLTAKSIVTQNISTDADGVVVDFEVTTGSNKASVSVGEITTTSAGLWGASANLNLNTGAGFADTIESWVEYYNGSTWERYEDSGRIINFSVFSESTIAYVGLVDSSVGEKFRIKIRATGGTPTLARETLSNGEGVASATMALVQVSEA